MNFIEVYTDGSVKGYKKKTKGYGGWAYLHVACRGSENAESHDSLPNASRDEVDCEEVHRESGSQEKTTSNRMELTAILKSLLALGREAHKSKVIVYSDSAYSVNAFRDNWVGKWESNGYQTKQGKLKNKELWITLIQVVKQFSDIEFIHVKGHNGNKYNEEADKMAQAEAEKLQLEKQPDFFEEKRRYNRLRARKTWAVLRPRKPVIQD